MSEPRRVLMRDSVYDLARRYLWDYPALDTENDLDDLAIAIQAAIDDWIEERAARKNAASSGTEGEQ